jgi:hypothetical protein
MNMNKDDYKDYMNDDVLNDHQSVITINDQSTIVDTNQVVAITTFDNPFDPIDQFDDWFMFDCSKGYYTCSKLARLFNEFDGMTSIEEKAATELAIDRLVNLDPLNIYKKVVKQIDFDKEKEEQLQFIAMNDKKKPKNDDYNIENVDSSVVGKAIGTIGDVK